MGGAHNGTAWESDVSASDGEAANESNAPQTVAIVKIGSLHCS